MSNSLEELKQQANDSKQRKKDMEKYETDLRADDMLFILHKEEVDTLEDVLLDILSEEPIDLDLEGKRHLLGILKFLQAE